MGSDAVVAVAAEVPEVDQVELGSHSRDECAALVVHPAAPNLRRANRRPNRPSRARGHAPSMRLMTQRLRRSIQTIKERDATITKLRAENTALQKRFVLKKGKMQRYFSTDGGLQLALRQSASLAASHSFGVAAAIDIHGSNISRWQVKLRACQILTA